MATKTANRVVPKAGKEKPQRGSVSSRAPAQPFNVDQIIKCYHLSYPSRHKPEAVEASGDQPPPSNNGEQLVQPVAEDERKVAGSPGGSMGSVGPALSRGSNAKRTVRHIHRKSIATRGDRRNSSTSSVHHMRSSSIAMAMHKLLQPSQRISTVMCTIPSCVGRHHSHSKDVNHTSKPSETRRFSAKVSGVTVEPPPSGAIYIKHYLDAFRELCKLLTQFGSTLSFVVENLLRVIGVLDQYLSSDKGDNYEHVELMIKYETKNKLVHRKINGKDSGTKTLLLLHRSLSFILEFILGLKNSGAKAKTSTIAQQAFDSTIAKYYSWIVKQMASMAFSSLPSVQECFKRLAEGNSKSPVNQLKMLLEAAAPVYNRVHDIYSKYQLLRCV